MPTLTEPEENPTMTEIDSMLKAGLSPLSARFFAARNAVISERNEKVRAAYDQCQADLKALREQYNADRANEATPDTEGGTR